MRNPESAWREFVEGTIAISPICIAAIPIGMVWGTLAVERGLSLFGIGLMSATVFAGASQFVAIGLWAEPLPALAIIFATLMINLRHLMMSASLGRSMGRFSMLQRLTAFAGLTDESWALAETRGMQTELTPAYYAGLVLPLLLAWTLGTLTGGIFGKVIGDTSAYGLDFAFSAMFIGLIVGFRTLPSWLPVVATSAGVSALTYQFLPPPWFVLIGSIVAMAVAASTAQVKPAQIIEV